VFVDAGPGTAIITASLDGEGATLSACSPSCEAEIGSTVEIEALPEEGFYVDSWTGCTEAVEAVCTVKVAGATAVVAAIRRIAD
jgi:hypothetical protein